MNKEVKKYSAEMKEHAVRMLLEHAVEYLSQRAATCSVAAKIGCNTAGYVANFTNDGT